MKLRTLTNILPLVLLALSNTTSSQVTSTSTATTLTTSSTSSTSTTTFSSTSTSTPRPIYAIAHRILTTPSLHAALTHGANVLEIDLTAHTYEWYTDHDNTLCSARATARSLFTAIADARSAGANISFVWLDIKNPDDCVLGRGCSIQALRDLAREILGEVGIGVLYGFYEQEGSTGFEVIGRGLRGREAVVLSGEVGEVEGWFDHIDVDTDVDAGNRNGSGVAAAQRVMDYGAVDLTSESFGSCNGTDGGVCSVLKTGAQARDDGQIGAVMAWTTTRGQGDMVQKMLGEAGVDGIIYGLGGAEYADDETTRAAYEDIETYVRSNGDLRMATAEDLPW
ncbi:hypothetical protein P170DRAFT_474318 [Aspergillus steynii IBT 23096]|uniref:Phospholipase D n=1 Tax=Aspergillus steynii IBT 23096 TaxID=1392250 RepID=A0A2I2GD12_9EURO|nr:uncharacterized protein P170DRAFT_474318 [Aspergillus steynii IBT 23096]PLB50763.1 hypothetical protein P170DRAFT_474318 [Aspergillus steynii IBT 23096]